MQETIYLPGDRVMVFDYSLFKNDVSTPLSHTMRAATVVRWYGEPARHYHISDTTLGPYPELLDVVFDHRPERESCGHIVNRFNGRSDIKHI